MLHVDSPIILLLLLVTANRLDAQLEALPKKNDTKNIFFVRHCQCERCNDLNTLLFPPNI
jgi:hypothetical protein